MIMIEDGLPTPSGRITTTHKPELKAWLSGQLYKARMDGAS